MNLTRKLEDLYVPNSKKWKTKRKSYKVKSGAVKGVNVTKALDSFYKDVKAAGANMPKIRSANDRLSGVIDKYLNGVKAKHPDWAKHIQDWLFYFDGVKALTKEVEKLRKNVRPVARNFVSAWNQMQKLHKSGQTDTVTVKKLGKAAEAMKGIFGALTDTGDPQFNGAMETAKEGADEVYSTVVKESKLDSREFYATNHKKLHKHLLSIQTGIKLVA